MVRGLGTDIIEVARIEGAMLRLGHRFLEKIYTLEELEYCLKFQHAARHLAGRFAAKEAAVKALGTGFRDGIHWLDIAVQNDASGKPSIRLSPKLAKMMNDPKLIVSVSHCHQYATAVVIWCE